MKVFKKIILALVILIALLIGLSFILPKGYTVEKSIRIEAPADIVYDQAVHWENFRDWSPWSDLDPEMKTEITGTPGQVGSKYVWEGNKDAGSGSQTITAASPERVDIDLHFMEPFESKATTYFTFQPRETGVEVVWGMQGEMPRPMNLMSFFMKKSIGGDYQKGLARLKERCESNPVPGADNAE